MRKFVSFLTGATLLVLGVAWVEGQQPGGGGKGGFNFGPQTGLTLLVRADVKEELKITDEQMDKLPAEVMVAISKVLDEKQFKRFKQIDLQKRGNNAFKDKIVLKELKLSDDQSKNILTVLEDTEKEVAPLRPKFGGGGGKKGGGADAKGNAEKIQNLEKEAKEKVLTILSKDQRKQYREMVGEDFKFQQGFGGGKKGADPKKKDA